jgi:tetratricopeptide (TPR) repeat protein
MSFINEALKKAQKEKDTHYIEYNGSLTAGRKKRGISGGISGSRLFWSSLFIIALLIIGFFIYSILNSGEDQLKVAEENEQTRPREVKKVPMPAPEQKEEVDARSLYSRAKNYHTEGKLQQAKILYLESLKQDPGFLDSLNNLGIIYISGKDYENGRKYLEKAIRLKPEYPDPYYNLACLFSITGETGKSLEYLKKAVSLDSKVIEWAKKDTDLENLREIEEFKEIINQSGT